MMPLLAHVTESEYPLGLALFLGGLGAGIGIGVGLGVMKYLRSR
ncbi:hypothetical protein [Lacipirellula limnantheis]|uniref:Uncharacterized protein n=1 Tax=Lacipirellula limnantheis TaxID=2528024 RepID=A0A517U5I2_9BACT|nr:hypothetical protein [Lacipirellula limnantheis]QDT75892.1 hypothetical protein I41_51360 [Lacipirellula limnantheis]